MWIIIKYKTHEINILKKKISEILNDDPIYFLPQIKYNRIIKKKFKIFKKNILENYLICYHLKFIDNNILNLLKYSRGIDCVLDGFKNNQKEIKNFVNKCKIFEDKDGFIRHDFFKKENFSKGMFISGPFTNFVFDILSEQSDKIEILLGKYRTIISKETRYLYRPI